jgi:hypothetical protein
VVVATLRTRCQALGVTDLAGARSLEEERRRLAAEVAAHRASLARVLGGTTMAAMVASADSARRLLADTPAGTSSRSAADDVDARHQQLDDARHAMRAVERRADAAGAAAAAARTAAEAATSMAAAAEARRVAAVVALEEAVRALAESRAARSDEDLAAAAAAAREAAAAAVTGWQQAAAGDDPAALTTAERDVQRLRTEQRGLERSLTRLGEELGAIRARLEVHGEAGLHDRLAEARRRESAALAEREAVEGRAAAAHLLLTTLTRHRDEAARAYGAPLRAGSRTLGRLVFGPTFAVELDGELRIDARVLDGVPVPWAELSVGREGAARRPQPPGRRHPGQRRRRGAGGVRRRARLLRPGRVALVSAAFEAAAEDCQIIVLTCDPDRYRHLARATTHCLTAPREVDARRAG